MKAPDKIYMTPSYGEPDNVLLASFSKSHLDCHRDIEYIRKGILLEWAKEQLKTMRKNETIPSIMNAKCDIIENLLDKLSSM